MKSFLVIGVGRFGKDVARTLYNLGHEVVAVDTDPEKIRDIADEVTHAVTADCRDREVLKSLDAASFDTAVVSMARHVEESILITYLLKEIGVKNVIVKSSSHLHTQILEKIGADRIVFPEKDMAIKLAQSLSVDNVLDMVELSSDFSILEVKVPSAWIGKSLRALKVNVNYGVVVVARKSGEKGAWEVSVDPDSPFQTEDVLVVAGANSDVERLAR